MERNVMQQQSIARQPYIYDRAYQTKEYRDDTTVVYFDLPN